MKRFVSLFLILMLCLSVSAVPVTASDIDANDSIRFLKAIGVVDVDKAIEADKNITRADFAGLVSRIVMQGNEAAGFTAMFKDVTNKHEAFDAINCLGNLGIVSGYDNGYFKPNNSVTQAEAVKMLISALSWDNFMVDRNDYPASYLKAANKFEFFKGINFEQNAALTWEQAALLYSNVLHTNVIYQSSFGTVEQYVQEENVSYLNKYFDIYEAKGIVTDNGITTLSGKTRVGKDQMAIDGKGYYNIGVLSRNLIGNYVVAYYRQTQNEDRGTLVYTAVPEKKNETLKIKATDILGYHAGTYTYRESETDFKEHKAVLQSGFNVLYNGKAPVNLSSFTQAYMKPTYGYVELIDADKTEGYETVKIISRRTVV
ncbi:MAG: S-layer homology domain-containing protein, partial [Clostridia bacterium]|nr:S-layer homology domain-containing protein [Clostridia bacterium]